MKSRQDIWDTHKLGPFQLPPDAQARWPALPTMTVEEFRMALRTFKWSTAVGQGALHPRTVDFASDEAIFTLITSFRKCEEMISWPDERILTKLVRLPKPDGGSRLIGLMTTLVRVWGKARRPLSAKWEVENKSELVWGTGSGRSSSHSAFSHKLEAEVATLLN